MAIVGAFRCLTQNIKPLVRLSFYTSALQSKAATTIAATARPTAKIGPITSFSTFQSPKADTKPKEQRILIAGKLMKQPKSDNSAIEQLGRNVKRRDLLQQMARKWRNGDIYSPHDLTGFAMSKFRRKRAMPPTDVLDLLEVDPLKEYKVCISCFYF